jgi:3-deoxy-D-manno-octulosonate 8-phosphate phosphatase (KDO 8-P phosphatase)
MIGIERAAAVRVKLLILDVDGVLTDGRLIIGRAGEETKAFSVKDGIGIKLAQFAGIEVAFLSARSSELVLRRAEMLGVKDVRQGKERKLEVVRDMAKSRGLSLEEVAYIGDDVVDLDSVTAVGLGVAVADACDDLLAAASRVTDAPGGAGAIRETVEAILRARGDWVETYRGYLAAARE